jgi:flagellar biosynthesis protein
MSEEESSDFDRDRLAVALQYERGLDTAPKISAKGKGAIAEAIIALAKKHGVEIREDKDLAQLLSKFEIDTPIPTEAYMAVAEILSYIYRKNNQLKASR